MGNLCLIYVFFIYLPILKNAYHVNWEVGLLDVCTSVM
jgi:hypothetical protein